MSKSDFKSSLFNAPVKQPLDNDASKNAQGQTASAVEHGIGLQMSLGQRDPLRPFVPDYAFSPLQSSSNPVMIFVTTV